MTINTNTEVKHRQGKRFSKPAPLTLWYISMHWARPAFPRIPLVASERYVDITLSVMTQIHTNLHNSNSVFILIRVHQSLH